MSSVAIHKLECEECNSRLWASRWDVKCPTCGGKHHTVEIEIGFVKVGDDE